MTAMLWDNTVPAWEELVALTGLVEEFVGQIWTAADGSQHRDRLLVTGPGAEPVARLTGHLLWVYPVGDDEERHVPKGSLIVVVPGLGGTT